MPKLVILLLSLLPLVAFITPVYAITTTAPTLTVHSAWAVEDVAETGDLLVTFRYTMPATTWDDYGPSGAIVSLNETTLQQTRVPPTTGAALGGFYLPAGHSYTWNATATVTLDSNPSLFVNPTTSNQNVQYLATTGLLATSTVDQALYCTKVVGLLQAVEDQDASDAITPGTYVSGGNVTSAGTTAALAAFSAFADVMPGCFFVGVSGPTGFNPGTADLRDARIVTVSSSAAWARFDTLAGDYGFDNEGFAAALLGLSLSGLAVILFSIFTGSFLYASTVAGLVLLVGGMNAPGYLMQAAFVLAAVSAVGAGAFWSRQTP